MITHSNSKENIHRRGSTSVHLDAVIQFLAKKLHHGFFGFFWSLANFFRIGIKSNSCHGTIIWTIRTMQTIVCIIVPSSYWIAHNIFSKEVKQVLETRGGGTEVATELLKKQSESLAKVFTIFWVSLVLMVFRLNGC